MSVEAMQAIVNRYIQAFEQSDINLIRDIYADDATVEDPVGSEPIKGMDAILEFYQKGLASGVKLSLTQEIRVAGNSVAFAFDAKMPDMVIRPIDVFEVNAQGKVQSMRAYWSENNIKPLAE